VYARLGGESMGKGGDESDVVYKGSAEPMLVSPSDLYSDNEISVSDSRYSPCPTYTDTDYFALLTTVTNVNDFGLRRPFYSKRCYKNNCCSSA